MRLLFLVERLLIYNIEENLLLGIAYLIYMSVSSKVFVYSGLLKALPGEEALAVVGTAPYRTVPCCSVHMFIFITTKSIMKHHHFNLTYKQLRYAIFAYSTSWKVLAHEISHVLLRHGAEKLSRFQVWHWLAVVLLIFGMDPTLIGIYPHLIR